MILYCTKAKTFLILLTILILYECCEIYVQTAMFARFNRENMKSNGQAQSRVA